jgi:hypothetical protein
MPLVFARRREIFSRASAWLALAAGILAMGWVLLLAALTLLAPDYVNYGIFTQVILAAGLLALAQEHFPGHRRLLRAALLGCVLLVSVRAIGMTTWGAACAWKNSYRNTQAVLRAELAPYAASNQPVLVSSAYLYAAAGMRVRNAIDCEWYFDHAAWTNHAQLNGMIRLQPAKIVLTQFDYYRAYLAPGAPILTELRQHPELVEIKVRDLAALPVPDASPGFQRILQNISWAPVIVDLTWKTAAPP